MDEPFPGVAQDDERWHVQWARVVRRRPMLTGVACVIVALVIDISILPIGDVLSLSDRHPPLTAFQQLYLESQRELGRRAVVRKEWVPLKQMSPYLVPAVIVSEDATFWSHEGFDWDEIRESIERN